MTEQVLFFPGVFGQDEDKIDRWWAYGMDSDERQGRVVYRKWEDSVEMCTKDTVLSVHDVSCRTCQ
jgi:hypothetical protein